MRILKTVALLSLCASALFASPYKVTIDTSALAGGTIRRTLRLSEQQAISLPPLHSRSEAAPQCCRLSLGREI